MTAKRTASAMEGVQKKTKIQKDPSPPTRVLALSMRPNSLDDLIGQDTIIQSLNSQVSSGRIPHFFIIAGPVGTGKTTLAKIITKKVIGAADTMEINAANKNGVDDIRELIEKMKFKPVFPSKHRVVVMDEAHQLTNSAQNALLTETEDVPNHVFYIFCTSALNKIIPALQRRAYIITPLPLKSEDVKNLVVKAKEFANAPDIAEDSLVEQLEQMGITSPGLILQACERYFSGISAENSVNNFLGESKIDTLTFCRHLSSGNWKECCSILKDATKSDVPALRNSALGYMKSILLKTTGTKAVMISKAINHLSIDSIRADDGAMLPLFVASVCLACDALIAKSTSTTIKPSTTKPASSGTSGVTKVASK